MKPPRPPQRFPGGARDLPLGGCPLPSALTSPEEAPLRKTFRASLLFSALLLGSAGLAMAQGAAQGAAPGTVPGAVQGAARTSAPGAAPAPVATAPSQLQSGSQAPGAGNAEGARQATRHEAAGTTKTEGHAAATKHPRSGKAGASSHAAERAPEASAGKASGQVARSQPGTGPATIPGGGFSRGGGRQGAEHFGKVLRVPATSTQTACQPAGPGGRQEMPWRSRESGRLCRAGAGMAAIRGRHAWHGRCGARPAVHPPGESARCRSTDPCSPPSAG